MKKIVNLIVTCCLAATAVSCELFEMDNYDGPDASISGKLLDAKTGNNVPVEMYTKTASRKTSYYGVLVVEQQGWEAVEDQYWYVKYNGDYQNDLVFAGDYVMSTKRLPCYPLEEAFTVKKGSNTQDFTVTPFARVIDPVFSYDAATGKINATFKIELGDASKAGNIRNVLLCAYTDCFVSSNFNHCSGDPGASVSNVAEGETITLSIDTTRESNREEFKYKRDHYLRIAVLATGNGFNTESLYNFSDTYVMDADLSSVKLFNW